MRAWFDRLAAGAASWAGSPYAFAVALGVVLLWALLGPFFAFSDTWQLVINTGTTIVTFLMVFLIQNATNRGDLGAQIKLDELIRVSREARNELLGLEDRPEQDIKAAKADVEARCRDGDC